MVSRILNNVSIGNLNETIKDKQTTQKDEEVTTGAKKETGVAPADFDKGKVKNVSDKP